MKKILLVTSIFLFSCDIGEIAIEPHVAGAIQIGIAELEDNYKNQIFYNLSQNQEISRNIKTQWDIGFISDEIDKVVLNTSTGSKVWRVYNSDFNDNFDLSLAEWNWDMPSGNLDSTAFGNIDLNTIYIIDRGYNLNGNQRGYRKIKFYQINADSCEFKIGLLDNSFDTTVTLAKNKNKNVTNFTFSNFSSVDIEPFRTEWDLLFSHYTTIFYQPEFLPYLVTGALINTNNISVFQEKIKKFDSINLEDALNYQYSQRSDVIGYDWKSYYHETGNFTVDDSKTYVIKHITGKYYKLRFIDFYNSSGVKGYPTFEFQEL